MQQFSCCKNGSKHAQTAPLVEGVGGGVFCFFVEVGSLTNPDYCLIYTTNVHYVTRFYAIGIGRVSRIESWARSFSHISIGA